MTRRTTSHFPRLPRPVLRAAVAVSAVLACLVGGCNVDPDATAAEANALWSQVQPTLVSQTSPAGGAVVAAPRGSVSVYKLAARLKLPTVRIDHEMTTLSGPGNIVTLYAGPQPQAYVNGRRLADAGQIVAVGGVIFVPDSLAGRIRPMLVRREPAVPPQPLLAERSGSGGVVLIDPGHGGKDPGAASAIGGWEKSVVLPVSLQLAEHLRRRGVQVILSRTTDEFLELDDRADLANRINPDLLISVHADWARSRRANGHTVYVAEGASEQSRRAAEAITVSLNRIQPAHSKPKSANFRVLVRTRCPAVLVELGYLSNAAQARRLFDRGHQDELAEAIADAVVQTLVGEGLRR